MIDREYADVWLSYGGLCVPVCEASAPSVSGCLLLLRTMHGCPSRSVYIRVTSFEFDLMRFMYRAIYGSYGGQEMVTRYYTSEHPTLTPGIELRPSPCKATGPSVRIIIYFVFLVPSPSGTH